MSTFFALSLLVASVACHNPLVPPFEAPISVGHRGASGEYPENTLEAFAEATEQGSVINELDLMITADNRVAVIHDLTLDRTTDGTGLVADFTLAQIQSLDAGSWKHPKFAGLRVPSLEQAFMQFLALPDWRDRGLLLDIKYNSAQILDYIYALNLPDELLARLAMGTWTMEETEYTTELWGNRTQNCIIHSTIPEGLESRSDVTILNLWKQAIFAEGQAWVHQMRSLGKEVYGWTSGTIGQTIDDTARATEDGWNGVVTNWPIYAIPEDQLDELTCPRHATHSWRRRH